MNSANNGNALAQLKPTTKAARFRLLMPAIESKLRDGVAHAQIIAALAELGLEMSPGMYFNYLKRSRKSAAKSKAQAAAAASAPVNAAQPQPAQRPRTFNYDPRGIPDLLK